MAWTITGEAGKTLDETSRTFPALGIASWALKHKPFGEDSFVWTAKLDNATGAGTIIPQAGQVVEVWLDGVRKFRGHAGKPKVGLASVTVTIEGPFWWMSRIDLTGNQVDGTGDRRAGQLCFPDPGAQDIHRNFDRADGHAGSADPTRDGGRHLQRR